MNVVISFSSLLFCLQVHAQHSNSINQSIDSSTVKESYKELNRKPWNPAEPKKRLTAEDVKRKWESFRQKACLNEDSTISKPGLTDEQVKFAYESYKRMMKTDTYKIYQRHVLDYVEKLNHVIPDYDASDKENFKTWISQNIAKTHFKSIDEATSYKEQQIALLLKLKQENRDLYSLMDKATSPQFAEIMKAFNQRYK
jgi:hypothetical protein